MNKKNKTLREYLSLPYTVMLRRDDEGDIIARIKELDGCVADGQDEMDALGNLESAKALWIEAALNAGQDIPKPDEDSEELPSGKFLTRVPRSLHKGLVELAREEGVSLNQLVAVGLGELVGRKSVPENQVQEIHGSSSNPVHWAAGAYGSSQTPARLWLVNPSPKDASLMSQSIVEEISHIPQGRRKEA